MRTTVTLDDDVFEVAQAQAKASGERLGKVLSDLVRRGLESRKIRNRKTLPVFDVPRTGEIIPSDRASRMMADDAL
jgi:hypothetical protein